MILTNDKALAERFKKLGNLCFEVNGPRFVHYELGWNYRMTNLQVALGIAQLEKINNFITIKREIGALYQTQLSFLKAKGYQLPLTKKQILRITSIGFSD